MAFSNTSRRSRSTCAAETYISLISLCSTVPKSIGCVIIKGYSTRPMSSQSTADSKGCAPRELLSLLTISLHGAHQSARSKCASALDPIGGGSRSFVPALSGAVLLSVGYTGLFNPTSLSTSRPSFLAMDNGRSSSPHTYSSLSGQPSGRLNDSCCSCFCATCASSKSCCGDLILGGTCTLRGASFLSMLSSGTSSATRRSSLRTIM
mmetsp:Transcript_45963/g.74077  ORF Transcript_45963/g.74077 Transcript_45963/m.74077 type:complete len:207 (-) Transcript_45963:1141-1761(-)